MREDIEAGCGSDIRPAQFTIKVPLLRINLDEFPLVRLFAITADRKALPLTPGLLAATLARFG